MHEIYDKCTPTVSWKFVVKTWFHCPLQSSQMHGQAQIVPNQSVKASYTTVCKLHSLVSCNDHKHNTITLWTLHHPQVLHNLTKYIIYYRNFKESITYCYALHHIGTILFTHLYSLLAVGMDNKIVSFTNCKYYLTLQTIFSTKSKIIKCHRSIFLSTSCASISQSCWYVNKWVPTANDNRKSFGIM